MEELLKQLVSMKNTTNDLLANEDALFFCQNWLKEKGIRSRIFHHTDHPSLEWGASIEKTRIMLNTHIDVVPAPDSCFLPAKTGNRLFGRGTADTKAMAAVFLSFSADEVEQASHRGVRFVLVSDEEIGGDTTKVMLPKLTNLKFALFGEPTQLHLNNEAKGIIQLRLTSTGKSAHGSRPWCGENAILSLMSGLRSFVKELPVPTEFTWDTTCNFSQIQGGDAINQVPVHAELLCDVRFRPDDSVDELLQKFRRHFGNDSVEILRQESPIFTEENNDFVQLLAEQLRCGGILPQFSRELGSSDARHCTQLGIPAVVFGPIGGGLHEDGEWVDLSSIKVVKNVLSGFFSSAILKV